MAIAKIEQVNQPTWAHQNGTLYTFDDGWRVLVLHPNAREHLAWVRLFDVNQEVGEDSPYRSQYYLETWNEEGGYPPRGSFTDTDTTSHQYIEALASQSPQLAQLWRAVQYDMAARAVK